MTESIGIPEASALGTDKAITIGVLEQKIKQCEKALIEEESKLTAGWMPLVGSIGIVIFGMVKITWHYAYLLILLFGLLYFAFNVWRLYRANQRKKGIEGALKQFKFQESALRASLNEENVGCGN